MTPERAFNILESCRSTVKATYHFRNQIAAKEKRLQRLQSELHSAQKLTATYGKEVVKGGRLANPIEVAIALKEEREQNLKAEIAFYQMKLDDAAELQRMADIIIRAMPKKTWKLANYYYRKRWSVANICRFKHWSSRNSWYKWIAKYEQIVIETLTKK